VAGEVHGVGRVGRGAPGVGAAGVLSCRGLIAARTVVSEPHAGPHALAHLPSLLAPVCVWGGDSLSAAKGSVGLFGHGGSSPALMSARRGEEELALQGQASEEPVTAGVPGQSSRSASGRACKELVNVLPGSGEGWGLGAWGAAGPREGAGSSAADAARLAGAWLHPRTTVPGAHPAAQPTARGLLVRGAPVLSSPQQTTQNCAKNNQQVEKLQQE